jgi:hypothetical protein
MLLHTKDNIDFKSVTKNLKNELSKLNLDLSHSATLNLVSRALGYENYNTYKSISIDDLIIEKVEPNSLNQLKNKIEDQISHLNFEGNILKERSVSVAVTFISRFFEMILDGHFDKLYFEEHKRFIQNAFFNKRVIKLRIKHFKNKDELLEKLYKLENDFLDQCEKDFKYIIRNGKKHSYRVELALGVLSKSLGEFIYSYEILLYADSKIYNENRCAIKGLELLNKKIGNMDVDKQITRHQYGTIKDGVYKLSSNLVIDRTGILESSKMVPQNKEKNFFSRELVERDYIPISEDELKKAKKFIRKLKPLKHISDKMTSYGLKHLAEKYIRATSYKDNKSAAYIGNGTFIVAMIQSGFDMKPTNQHYELDDKEYSPNAYFNVSVSHARKLVENIK